MNKIIQAFIFAAGRGERMRPFTDSTPKPLAQINKKPILGHIIENLSNISSIQNIIVNGYYLAKQIENYLQSLNNPKISFSLENEKLETGGGLVYAAQNSKFDKNQPILLVNGDIFWQNPDLTSKNATEIQNLSNFYQENDCDIALGLVKTAKLIGYKGNGDFNLSQSGNLTKSDQNSHVFVGLAIINPKILEFSPSKAFSMGYFYNNAQNLGLKIKGLELGSQFFHIGDIESLGKVRQLL